MAHLPRDVAVVVQHCEDCETEGYCVTENNCNSVDWACPHCGGKRRILRTIPERRVINRGPPLGAEDRRHTQIWL
jgi:hypothetical protein